MKIVVIGASGLVGSNCLRHFKEMGHEVVGTYFSYQAEDTAYFDTLQPGKPVNFDITGFQPEVIVHCGALTFVDYCEQHPEESFEKTVIATKNVVEIANTLGAKVVFISTDYIFDGNDGPYSEDATPNPISIYGSHKYEAELLVRDEVPEHIIIRITNVYGNEERGKNFVSRIIDQAIKGEHLTLKLPMDQYASPVNARDVARAIQLLLTDGHSGIFHIAATDYMNRVQLAQTILKYFPDADYELHALATNRLQQPAARPLQGGLKPAKFLSLYPSFNFSNVDDHVREVLARQS